MATERQLQHVVSQTITGAQIVPERYYHLCWWEDGLRCLHARHTKEVHEVFYSAPGKLFLNGLSSYQWELITTRITDFCRRRRVSLRGASGHSTGETMDPVRGRPVQVTHFDSMRLRALVATAGGPESPMNSYFDKLLRLLETAETLAPQDIPADVVTMNSQVRLKDDEGRSELTLSLVFPADAVKDSDIAEMNVSVLSPIGLSILGRRVGDVVDGRIRVDSLLYQPEAAGDFHL